MGSVTDVPPDGDLFELLFPESGPRRDEARRWSQFLRLLVDDARAAPAATSGELRLARHALVSADRELAARALDDLLAHLFDALLDGASCFALGRPTRSWSQAWHAFVRAGGDATPPAPGESRGAQAARWVDVYARLGDEATGAESARIERRAHAWRFALVRALEGPDALATRLERRPRGLAARVAALEATVLLALERCDPRAAREALARDRAAVAVDPELARLVRLVACFLGDANANAGSFAGTVPEHWRAFLPDAPPNPRGATPPPDEPPPRRALGAALVAVFVVEHDGRLRLAEREVAPALVDRVEAFADERGLCWRDDASPERVALETAAPDVRRGTRLEGVLAPDATRAVARVPLPLDGPAGWVHLEFEHGLVPGPAQLTALASAWSSRLARARPEAVAEALEPYAGARAAFAGARLSGAPSAAWYDVVLGQAVPIARGPRARPTSSDALERATRLGLAQRGSRHVVPLLHAGRVVGLVVDGEAPDESSIDAWQDARFADWHAERFDKQVEPRAARAGLDAATLARIARARTDVELSGGDGSGRETFARRLAFERDPAGAVLAVHDGDDLMARLGDERTTGTLVCRNAERWSRRGQLALATAPLHLRFVAVVERPLADGVAAGTVEPALAARFARLARRVPALAEARSTIGALVDLILSATARAEGWPEGELEDEARALLWRQPWTGGVRQLEATLYRAALEGAFDVASLTRVLADLDAEVVLRLPTSDSAALAAALDETRLANGRANRRRAALYLGWDRDTVAARL